MSNYFSYSSQPGVTLPTSSITPGERLERLN